MRFKRNHVVGILDENEVWVSEINTIQNVFCNYYYGLFDNNGLVNLDAFSDCIVPVVSSQMNSRLSRHFSKEDIKMALFQMHPVSRWDANPIFSNLLGHYWG